MLIFPVSRALEYTSANMNRLITLDLQDWKRLVFGNGSGGREKPVGKPFEKPIFLFDLERDPSEKENLIDSYSRSC